MCQTNSPKKYYLIVPFMLTGIFLFTVHLSCWYLILLLIPFLYTLHVSIKIKWLVIYLIITLLIIGLSFVLHEFILFEHINEWFENLTHFSFRNQISHYIDRHYNQITSSFIKLILLNIKEKDGKTIYYHMIDLSIVYLIVVSGFHISVLKRIVSRCFCKIPLIGLIVNLITITLYCYLLNFAVSVTRVLLMYLITIIFGKYLKNRIDILSVSALISLALGPSSMFNIGFCMSYLCTIVILVIFQWEISNPLLEKIVVNIGATLVSLPFVIHMQHQISIWVVLNSFVFSYIFALIFVYFILTFWIIWIAPLQYLIVKIINFLIESTWTLNTTISIKEWTPIIQSSYFIVFYLSIRMIQSYQFRNKDI
jgi:competence protein ComEC